MKRLILFLILIFVVACNSSQPKGAEPNNSLAAVAGQDCIELYVNGGLEYQSPACMTATPQPTRTATATPLPVPPTLTPKPTRTPLPPTLTPTATPTQTTTIEPFPAALPCTDHDNNTFHTIWNEVEGCHYDHEHGTSPFTAEVAAAFPGFDLFTLLGGVEVGHTNPSSAAENTDKHGGFEWNVQLIHPEGCLGFEGATNGVNGSVVQYHAFGDYSHELESEFHSAVALLRICNEADPTNYGYLYIVQFKNYGQVVAPYQGLILEYPYYSVPAWPSPRGMYLTVNCIDVTLTLNPPCRDSLTQAQNNNSDTSWTSKRTGQGERPPTSTLLRLLFRARDAYQAMEFTDQEYPHNFLWLCTIDGGVTFYQPGCEHNNSTLQLHEISGVIPIAWDGLAGWDMDGAVNGRLTADGFVTRYGVRNENCTAPDTLTDCFPFKAVNVPVGSYGSALVFTPSKGGNIVPYLPEWGDIYFCGTAVCNETDPGAVPSGWIGAAN